MDAVVSAVHLDEAVLSGESSGGAQAARIANKVASVPELQ
jgi:hypothetical protein